MGAGGQGLQRPQVDGEHPVVAGVGVGGEGGEIPLAALGGQKLAGDLVGGEDGGGGPQLGAHVGDGGPLGHAEGGDPLAGVLDYRADAALDRQLPQNGEDDVLGGDAGPQGPGEFHLDDPGHGDVVGPAAHGHRHVQPAGADGQHADAAAGGGVAVRADEGLARHAVALQVHLVADAVAGAGEVHPDLFGHGLGVFVVVGVFKARLQGVVVDVGDRFFGLDPGDADGLEFQIGHGPGGVLGEGLVDFQADLAAGRHVA